MSLLDIEIFLMRLPWREEVVKLLQKQKSGM
jgi:hypothetical protein